MPFLQGSTTETTNTEVAAALGAMDIRLASERPIRRVEGDCSRVSFFFEPVSPCGNYATRDMLRAWDDREWQWARPKHPLTYLRLFFRNCARLRDHFHGGVPIGALRREGKVELITLRGGGPLRGEPNPVMPGPAVETDDLELAAALFAVGVGPCPDRPWSGSSEKPRFRFLASSPCGDFRAAPLALAWAQAEWFREHSEHPWAYLKCGAENKRWLVQRVRRTVPSMCLIQRNGLPAFLSADAPDSVQAPFFRELK